MNRVRTIIGVVLVFWSSSAVAATLTWTANSDSDLAGYRVYQCSHLPCAPGSGNQSLLASIGKVTTFNIGTPTVTQYYFITAYDTANNESLASNLVTFTPGTSISLLQTASVNSHGVTLSQSFAPTTTNLTKGSLLVIMVTTSMYTQSDGTTVVTDNCNSGNYTNDVDQHSSKSVLVYSKMNTCTNKPTITVIYKSGGAPVNSEGTIYLYELKCSLQCIKGASAISTTNQAASPNLTLTTTHDHSFVVSGVGNNGGPASSAKSGFTLSYATANDDGYEASEYTTDAGTAAPITLTFGGNGNNASIWYQAAVEYYVRGQ